MFESPIKDEGSLAAGFFSALGLFVLLWIIGFFASDYFSNGWRGLYLFFATLPILQFCYILPLYRGRKQAGSPQTARGLVVGACVVFLVHETCSVGLLMNSR